MVCEGEAGGTDYTLCLPRGLLPPSTQGLREREPRRDGAQGRGGGIGTRSLQCLLTSLRLPSEHQHHCRGNKDSSALSSLHIHQPVVLSSPRCVRAWTALFACLHARPPPQPGEQQQAIWFCCSPLPHLRRPHILSVFPASYLCMLHRQRSVARFLFCSAVCRRLLEPARWCLAVSAVVIGAWAHFEQGEAAWWRFCCSSDGDLGPWLQAGVLARQRAACALPMSCPKPLALVGPQCHPPLGPPAMMVFADCAGHSRPSGALTRVCCPPTGMPESS